MKRITPAQIADVARALLPIFLNNHADLLKDKKGLMLAIIPRNTLNDNSAEFDMSRLGDMPTTKILEKQDYAREKIMRLRRRTEGEGLNEVTSLESENEDNKEFGGAIVTKDYYLSVSNFPPHIDQKFVVQLGLLTNQLTMAAAQDIYDRTREQRKKWREKINSDID